MTDEWVAVPPEIDDVADAVDRLIVALDDLIVTRQGAYDNDLGDWTGTARVAWDEAFTYSQADLGAQVDQLQAIHAGLDAIRQAIHDHNAALPREPLFGGLGESLFDEPPSPATPPGPLWWFPTVDSPQGVR
jgi:hypothetical protein